MGSNNNVDVLDSAYDLVPWKSYVALDRNHEVALPRYRSFMCFPGLGQVIDRLIRLTLEVAIINRQHSVSAGGIVSPQGQVLVSRGPPRPCGSGILGVDST